MTGSTHTKRSSGTSGPSGFERIIRKKRRWTKLALPGFASSRVTALKQRIGALSLRIKEEAERPLPCTLNLSRLKRERLFLKDEINRLERLNA